RHVRNCLHHPVRARYAGSSRRTAAPVEELLRNSFWKNAEAHEDVSRQFRRVVQVEAIAGIAHVMRLFVLLESEHSCGQVMAHLVRKGAAHGRPMVGCVDTDQRSLRDRTLANVEAQQGHAPGRSELGHPKFYSQRCPRFAELPRGTQAQRLLVEMRPDQTPGL